MKEQLDWLNAKKKEIVNLMEGMEQLIPFKEDSNRVLVLRSIEFLRRSGEVLDAIAAQIQGKGKAKGSKVIRTSWTCPFCQSLNEDAGVGELECVSCGKTTEVEGYED